MLLLRILDIVFIFLHLCIIFFNLCGWIWKKTLPWHLLSVLVTALSWLLLGIWYGLGYCFLTDWHWQVKQQLGESGLPASFITWFAREVWPWQVNSVWVDWITASGFTLAVILSFYRNHKNGLFKKSWFKK